MEASCLNKIDKSMIPVCNIMGVEIAAVNMEWLLSFTHKNIRALSGNYMCVSNVHTTVTAYENEEYRNAQNGGILAIPDGGPLSTVGRKRGFTQMERITGPSYMEEILKVSSKYGYKHYFYGSTPETLLQLKIRLKRKYPDIRIVGMYSPPFRSLTDEENDEIVNKICKASPDFLWVGLGAPKQEMWMYAHKQCVKGFMVGVGAGFDYLAGNIDRAPMWMQNHNLEWLYRLKQEPKRLFKRYWHTNLSFIWNAYLRRK